MAYLKRIVLMLQFLTTIPIPVNIRSEREDFGRGLSMAPVVGLILGILLAAGNWLLRLIFPPMVSAVLTFVIYILLTGGLHLDGLGDTADGLFSNRPRERMLEIMKDSRVGTNAVLTLIIVLLLDISLIASIQSQLSVILILMPVAGRIGSLVGAGSSGYAGTSDGPGRWCVEECRPRDVMIGLIVYFILFGAIIGTSILLGHDTSVFFALIILAALIPPLSAFVLARILGRKLGGVTGDILGSICELNQTFFLIISYFLFGMV